MSSQTVVFTGIHGVTPAIERFAAIPGWDVVLVGDRRTPPLTGETPANIRYYDIAEQARLPFTLPRQLPFDHYARKNVGYLAAIADGARRIADSDDDNAPSPRWGRDLPTASDEIDMAVGSRFVNVYRWFSATNIWPRGFPLARAASTAPIDTRRARAQVAVWQGLVENEPDVDAIFRLVIGNEVTFLPAPPVALDRGVYCPFNSQNTIWEEPALPYLYLPTTVTFRFTDILRGYVAQRGLHAMGLHVAFTQATARQERNPHDLLRDFADEIPCYLQAESVVDVLESVSVSGRPADDLPRMYQALTRAGIVTQSELPLLDSWLEDMARALASELVLCGQE